MKKSIHTKTLTLLAGVMLAGVLYSAAAFADAEDTSVKYTTPLLPGVTDYSVNTGDGITLDVNVAAINALEITLSTSNLAIDLTPKVGTASFGNDTLNILVGTTNFTGYTLTMEPSYNDASTTSLTRTESINAVVPTIDTIDFATSATTFASTSDTATMNRWGYMLGTTNLDVDKTIYNPVLTSNTINMATTAVSNHPSSITFAAKANSELPAGDYRATLKFMAVTNYVPTRVTDLTYMQDFTTLSSVERAEVLSTMALNEQYQLKDSRDNKKYWISKLETSCDNPRAMKETSGSNTVCYQVWMTQNLDLDLETSANNVAALTNLNTDINVCGSGIYTDGYTVSGTTCTWVPERATATDVADTANDVNNPYSLDVGAVYYYPGATAGENGEQPASCPTNETCNHYLAGNYYNWTAAVASNNSASQTTNYTNASNSICPAGWGLPSGLTGENGYSDFNYLLVQQGITSSYSSIENYDTGWNADGYIDIQRTPLYIVRSGLIGYPTNNDHYGQASYGLLRSSTTYGTLHAYSLNYGEEYVSPARGDSRSQYLPVRCLLRPTIDDLSEMQDFASLTSDQTSHVLASMATSTASTPVSYQLTDNRDGKKYWISKLRTANDNPRGMVSTDGNKYQIWMTQNLDLDLETTPNKVAALTSKNTDLNSTTGIYSAGYSMNNGVITWTPSEATKTDVAQTTNNNTEPVSLDVGTDTYYYPGTTAGVNGDQPASCVNNAANCEHWVAGNYYNWTAAVASNNSAAQTANYSQAANSICPAGWRMPTGLTSATCTNTDKSGCSDFNFLLVQQGIAVNYVGTSGNSAWTSDGFSNIQTAPVYFIKSGNFSGERLDSQSIYGNEQSNTAYSATNSYNTRIHSNGIWPAYGNDGRYFGFPVRCLVR